MEETHQEEDSHTNCIKCQEREEEDRRLAEEEEIRIENARKFKCGSCKRIQGKLEYVRSGKQWKCCNNCHEYQKEFYRLNKEQVKVRNATNYQDLLKRKKATSEPALLNS